MGPRKVTMVALIAGIVIGAVSMGGLDFYRRSHEIQSFQKRAHCKAVADAYVKANADLNSNSENGKSVTLDRVDYSPARNSCVAEVETSRFFRGGGTEDESVEDLLSGETLFSVQTVNTITGTDDLGALRVRFLPIVWDYVMNNSSKPVKLEKEWTLTAAMTPKSTLKTQEQFRREMEALMHPEQSASRPSLAEPNDWQTVPAMGKQDFYPDVGKSNQAQVSKHKTAH